MKIYLVGGAVRDQLLGRTVSEYDYVVVGGSRSELLQQGYEPVGKDFPVFLHPQTRSEYALARTERKSGTGYHGFEFNIDDNVTLEEDLRRRDLTINAMAMDEYGNLIDPHGGQRDLQARCLRHVSPAFVEDPLRVLRVARFAARYAESGFHIAPETLSLMQQLANSGELASLTPERVWRETSKALSEYDPAIYFETLHDTGALKILMPELDRLWGIPNPAQWHPEIDTGIHTMMVLRQACKLSTITRLRFAALMHDAGKAMSPHESWPSHRGHEEAGVNIIKNFCARLKIPNDHMDLAVLCSRLHLLFHRGFLLRPGTVVRVLMQADALRRPERFAELLLACESDFRGRLHWEERAYPQRAFWQQAADLVRVVPVQPLLQKGFRGAELADRLYEARAQEMSDWRASLAHNSSELA